MLASHKVKTLSPLSELVRDTLKSSSIKLNTMLLRLVVSRVLLCEL